MTHQQDLIFWWIIFMGWVFDSKFLVGAGLFLWAVDAFIRSGGVRVFMEIMAIIGVMQ